MSGSLAGVPAGSRAAGTGAVDSTTDSRPASSRAAGTSAPGTFVPAPGAGPLASRVAAQARAELAVLFRNGEQLLVTIVLPVLVLVGLVSTSVLADARADRIALAVPGVLGLAVVSSAFTSLAIATGFERRYGVLRRLGATPLGRGGLVAGKALATLAVLAVQAVVIAGVGLLLGWRPGASGLLEAVAILVLGTIVFAGLGGLLAGTARPEAVLAVANLAWVLLLAAGGLVSETSRLPGAAGVLARLLPSGALGDALRDLLAPGVGSGTMPLGLAILVLIVWGVIGWAATARFFRWD